AGKAVFGILAALWSASSGVSAVIESLNIAYDVKEDRPTWKQKGVAVGLTLALAVLVLGALGLTLYGGDAADYLGAHLGIGLAIVVGGGVKSAVGRAAEAQQKEEERHRRLEDEVRAA